MVVSASTLLGANISTAVSVEQAVSVVSHPHGDLSSKPGARQPTLHENTPPPPPPQLMAGGDVWIKRFGSAHYRNRLESLFFGPMSRLFG